MDGAGFAKTVLLAWTGASGAHYGLRLLECLIQQHVRVYLTLSDPARVVLHTETALRLPPSLADTQAFLDAHFATAPGQLQVLARDQWTAPVASGSAQLDAMVVCPCTTATLSAIATGASRSLTERAADVTLKERRTLILVVRETPLSAIHLGHMLSLAQMGVVIMPASPAFYHRPQTLNDLVDFMVARVLDHLGIRHSLIQRWGETDI